MPNICSFLSPLYPGRAYTKDTSSIITAITSIAAKVADTMRHKMTLQYHYQCQPLSHTNASNIKTAQVTHLYDYIYPISKHKLPVKTVKTAHTIMTMISHHGNIHIMSAVHNIIIIIISYHMPLVLTRHSKHQYKKCPPCHRSTNHSPLRIFTPFYAHDLALSKNQVYARVHAHILQQ